MNKTHFTGVRGTWARPFLTLLCVICVLLFFPSSQAATVISATLTITNSAALTNATSGQSYTLNSDTRTFTNTLANAATQIRVRTNDSASTILLSLVAQANAYPFGPIASMTTSSGTNVTFRATNDIALTITLSPTNWGKVIYSTQTVGTAQTVVRVPISAEDSSAQTNIASLLWDGINTYSQNRGFGRAEFSGRVEFDAGIGFHGRALVATNYTLTTNDIYVGVDTRSNTNLILTMPTAASASNLLFLIKDEGGAGATNTIKIYPASGDRIDTLLTNLVISNNFGGVQLVSRGSTNWAILASGGGVTGGIASGGGGVPLTNTVWVAKNGSDSTGERGDPAKAFLTLGTAKTNAVSGDTIFVMPGIYDDRNLLKNGVNWHFFNGAKVTYTGTDPGGIFDDTSSGANANVTSTITGYGEFDNQNPDQYYVLYLDKNSTIRFQGRSSTSLDYVFRINGGTNIITIEDMLITGVNRNPITINSATSLTLNRCKLVMNDTDNNGAALWIAGTNTLIRDSVLQGKSSASSPVAIKGDSGTKVRVDGGLISNLGNDANVSIVTDEDRWIAGGIPRNDVVYHPTNTAPFNIVSTDFALDTTYTNGTQRAHVSASFQLVSTNDASAIVALYLDQDANGSFEKTGRSIELTSITVLTNTLTGIMELSAWLQPGAIFIFTNLSGSPATASVVADSSQWVKH